MTVKLALIDYDGPLADITDGLAYALETFYAFVPDALAHLRTEKHARANDIYWQTLYSADVIAGAVPVVGAATALALLRARGYEVVILTSRPDTCYTASLAWLQRYTMHGTLVMKPADARMGTPLLKAVLASGIIHYVGPDDILIVDDSEANRKEFSKFFPGALIAETLAEALALDKAARD